MRNNKYFDRIPYFGTVFIFGKYRVKRNGIRWFKEDGIIVNRMILTIKARHLAIDKVLKPPYLNGLNDSISHLIGPISRKAKLKSIIKTLKYNNL
jgi:hypothetical protein